MGAIKTIVGAITGWWRKMFRKQDIQSAFGASIVPLVSPEMQSAQEVWRGVYYGRALWNVETTIDGYKKKIPSLGLGSAICRKLARYVCVEAEFGVEGKNPRAEYLNAQYKAFCEDLQQTVETVCYNGTVVFRPFVRGEDILVTTVENNCFYPLAYDETGELVSAIFAETFTENDKVYTLLEKCDYSAEGETCSITYKAFASDSAGSLGKEVSLASVAKWAALEDFTVENVTRPWFVAFDMPNGNTVEQGAYMGAAVFAKAIEHFERADRLYEEYLWEYEGGELAVDAPADMFKVGRVGESAADPRAGQNVYKLPKGFERLYRKHALDPDEKNGNLFNVFNPDFRDESLRRGINEIKRNIEFACGLSYGTISDAALQDKTATEIKMAQQETFSTVAEIQQALGKALDKLVVVLDEMASAYELAPDGEYEGVQHEWQDSVIVDRETELKLRLLLMQNNILSAPEVRGYWLGVDPDSDEARRLPGAFEDGGAADMVGNA